MEDLQDVDLDDAVEETSECPACAGESYVLGILGKRIHFRCAHCGLDHSQDGE